jgi:hypothetical protein
MLFVRLLESLDAALLTRFIDVVDAKGQLVNGKVTVEEDERVWIFKPDQPWVAGKHSLEILKTLEDLAGNKIGRAFEVDRVEQPAATGPDASLTYSLPLLSRLSSRGAANLGRGSLKGLPHKR